MTVASKLAKVSRGRTSLHIATINASGIGGPTKRKAINDLLTTGDIDVLLVTETMLYEGQELIGYIDGFRGFFASISSEGRTNAKGTLIRAKWGVAVFVREGIKVGTILRGEKSLAGRVISVACAFEGLSKPIHFITAYAPVDKQQQLGFWNNASKWIKDNLKLEDMVILGGDLNDHILGPKTERWPLSEDFLRDGWVSTAKAALDDLGLVDTLTMKNFDIHKHYTFTHHGGTITRLDYITARNLEGITSHRTFNCDKISTSHRVVKVEVDLHSLGGAFHVRDPYPYPLPIKFDKDPQRVKKFVEKEEQWRQSFTENELHRLAKGPDMESNFIEKYQDTFLTKLEDLCVTQAAEIWPQVHSGGNKKAGNCKEAGVIIGTEHF